MKWSRSSTPRSCCRFRCWTIPPTTPRPSPKRWWSATARWATRSSIITAPTATDSRPARLQEGLETATGELVAVFDADFCPPPDFLMRTVHYFADPKVGRGADALELHQPRLQLPHGSGSHAAGRPLHPGARRAVARGLLLQLQRHGGHPAQDDDRRRGRLAARYAHRRFRPELPRATQGLAFRLPAGPAIAPRSCRWKCTASRCSNRAGPRG